MTDLKLPPVLLAKRAIREALASTATIGAVAILLANNVTWVGHGPVPVSQPLSLTDPIESDQLTLIGEVLADSASPDSQPHMFTQEPVTFAVVVNATVADNATMTADDYLDMLAAEIQAIVMADRTLAGTSRNVTYSGWEKRDVGMSTAIRTLIVNFEVLIRYTADNPLADSVLTTV